MLPHMRQDSKQCWGTSCGFDSRWKGIDRIMAAVSAVGRPVAAAPVKRMSCAKGGWHSARAPSAEPNCPIDGPPQVAPGRRFRP